MKVAELQAHPYAELFPLDDERNLFDLRRDIREHGQLVPIVTFRGKVLDGRRRLLCCQHLNIKPKFVPFKGSEDEALDFVVSTNLHRRHLGTADRAIIADKIAQMKKGRPSTKTDNESSQINAPRGAFNDGQNECENSNGTTTQAQAAAQMGVSRNTVQRVRKVRESGTPALQEAMKKEEVSIKDAAAVADLPPDEQDAAVDAVRNGQAKTAREAAAKQKTPEVTVATDEAGKPIPPHAAPAWDGARKIGDICRELDDICRRVNELAKEPGGRLIHNSSVTQTLKDVRGNLWSARATHVCPYCHHNGKAATGDKSCNCCKGQSWTNRATWKQCIGSIEVRG